MREVAVNTVGEYQSRSKPPKKEKTEKTGKQSY